MIEFEIRLPSDFCHKTYRVNWLWLNFGEVFSLRKTIFAESFSENFKIPVQVNNLEKRLHHFSKKLKAPQTLSSGISIWRLELVG